MRLLSTFISKFLITLFLVFATYVSLKAQEIKVGAQLDSSSIKIGQQTKLKLSIQYRADNGKHLQVQFPVITDTIRKEIEVVAQSKIDTLIDKNNPLLLTQTKTLYITSFDSGYWAIPPFKFNVSSDSKAVFTEALLLQVSGMAVDTTLAIKDIKPPFEETYTWLDWLKDNMYVVYIGIFLILLIIGIILMIRYLKRLKPPMVIVEAPKIPAHIIALGKLEELKEQKLWQEGKLKQFHSSLSDILREYIENRFKIPALEQTTDEILFAFRNVAIDEESRNKLKSILILADLVKFAKELPLPNENEMSIQHSYEFVNGTKREETISQESTDKKEEAK